METGIQLGTYMSQLQWVLPSIGSKAPQLIILYHT